MMLLRRRRHQCQASPESNAASSAATAALLSISALCSADMAAAPALLLVVPLKLPDRVRPAIPDANPAAVAVAAAAFSAPSISFSCFRKVLIRAAGVSPAVAGAAFRSDATGVRDRGPAAAGAGAGRAGQADDVEDDEVPAPASLLFLRGRCCGGASASKFASATAAGDVAFATALDFDAEGARSFFVGLATANS